MIAAMLAACISNLNILLRNVSYGTTIDNLFLTYVFNASTIMKSLFVAMPFLVLIHDFMSKDILNQGTYVLARLPDRRRWCFRKLMQLAVLCLAYVFVYIMTVFLLCVKNGRGKWGGGEGYAFLYMSFAWTALLLPCAIITVLLDMQSGREIAVLLGNIVLGAFMGLGFKSYGSHVNLFWQALNPSSGILLYNLGDWKTKAAFFLGFLADNGILAWWSCRYVQKFDVV